MKCLGFGVAVLGSQVIRMRGESFLSRAWLVLNRGSCQGRGWEEQKIECWTALQSSSGSSCFGGKWVCVIMANMKWGVSFPPKPQETKWFHVYEYQFMRDMYFYGRAAFLEPSSELLNHQHWTSAAVELFAANPHVVLVTTQTSTLLSVCLAMSQAVLSAGCTVS